MTWTWVLLALAIGSEVIGTTALRESEGLAKPAPVAVMVVAYAASFYFLSIVVKTLPLGLTYAIWAGTGTALVAAIGVVRFGEVMTWTAGAGIALVVTGIVLINLAAAEVDL